MTTLKGGGTGRMTPWPLSHTQQYSQDITWHCWQTDCLSVSLLCFSPIQSPQSAQWKQNNRLLNWCCIVGWALIQQITIFKHLIDSINIKIHQFWIWFCSLQHHYRGIQYAQENKDFSKPTQSTQIFFFFLLGNLFLIGREMTSASHYVLLFTTVMVAIGLVTFFSNTSPFLMHWIVSVLLIWVK